MAALVAAYVRRLAQVTPSACSMRAASVACTISPSRVSAGIAVFLGFAFALFSVLGYLFTRNQLRDFDKIHDVDRASSSAAP